MKVLSLFDGMACGMIAMQLAGVEVESYDAYEIDKYAIKTAQHNFPMIKEHGDVFDADFTQYEGADFLIGGSPCTYWSIAQTKNRETVASGMGWDLFCQYVRALHESKPKYFIYENNKSMSKDIRASIDKAFGFEAVLINSALVSAQNRQRLYWVGKRNEDGTYSKVNVEQPADRGIILKDVLDNAVAMREKAHTIDANYYKGGNFTSPHKQSGKRLMAAEPVCVAERGRMYCGQPQHYEARTDGKTNTLTSVEKDNRVAEPVSYCTDKNIEHLMRNFGSKGKIVDEESKTPTLMAAAGMGGGNHIYYADSIAEPINVTADGKAQCLRATCYKDGIRNIAANVVDKKTGVAEPINVTAGGKAFCVTSRYYKGFGKNPSKCLEKHRDSMVAEYARGKEITIYEVRDGKITIKGKQYPIKLKDGHYIIRKLTVSECKRLQTVPEWYEFPVSNSQAYKMLGNGWTCEVICHLISSCFKSTDVLPGQIGLW